MLHISIKGEGSFFWSMLLSVAALCVATLACVHGALVQTGVASWGARSGHSCVFTNSSMYVLGGKLQNGAISRDAWVSSAYPFNTGALVSATSLPGPRAFGAACYYSDRIVYVGGNNGTRTVGSVWSTTDGGASWQVHADPGWSPRERFGLLQSNRTGAFYLFGGLVLPAQVTFNDLWWSSDGGLTWTLHTANTGVPARYGFASASNGDSMYVMGGMDSDGNLFADVWTASYSSDYLAWYKVDVAGTPVHRMGAASFVSLLSSTIHVLGGVSGSSGVGVNSHVQSTSKWGGRMWCMPDSTNPLFEDSYGALSYYGTALYNGTTLIMSGGSNGTVTSDLAYAFTSADPIYCNPNQTQWMFVSSFATQYGARYGHTSNYIGDSLYVFGGQDPNGVYLDSALRYTKSLGWLPITHDGSVFTPRAYHCSVTHKATGCVYIWAGDDGTAPLFTMIKFCEDTQQFSLVSADTGLYGVDLAYTIEGSRIFTVTNSEAKYTDFPFTAWSSGTYLTTPLQVTAGALIYDKGNLVLATGFETPVVNTARIFTISEANFVSITGQWTAVSAPYGKRGRIAGVKLESVDTLRAVPAVVSTPVNASLFISCGESSTRLYQDSYLQTINGAWVTTNPYQSNQVNANGQTVWFMPSSVGFAVAPDSKSVTITGGILGSNIQTQFLGDALTYGANACLSDPCVCGACIPGTEYQCSCPPGFNGTRCEFAPNACDSNPCQNGGNCTSTCNVFSCGCVNGYTGPTCGSAPPPPPPTAPSSSTGGEASSTGGATGPVVSSSSSVSQTATHSSSASLVSSTGATPSSTAEQPSSTATHSSSSSSFTGGVETSSSSSGSSSPSSSTGNGGGTRNPPTELEASAQSTLTIGAALLSGGLSAAIVVSFVIVFINI